MSHVPRIALVRQKYRPDGGAERFVGRALHALGEQALDVSIITREWQGPEQHNYHICLCDPVKLGRISRERGFAKAAQQLFASGQFDLIQSHERIAGCDIYRAGDGVHRQWLRHRSRVLPKWRSATLWLSPYHQYVMAAEKAMYQHPNLQRVICNSKMVRDEIVREFGLNADKIRVIYSGVDTKAFHPDLKQQRTAVRARLGVTEQTPVWLFVGSGFERKGVAPALQALAASDTEGQLWVVGQDKHQRHYEQMAESLGIAKRVQFLGVQKDVKPYYGAADGLLLPTLYDPFPNVILEAMAAGLGVITSHQCGGAEFIDSGVNGYVADALDIEQLASAINRCRGHEKALGEAARRTVQPYTLEAMTDNLLSLYRELLPPSVV